MCDQPEHGKYESFYKHAPVSFFMIRISDGEITDCNESFAKLIGLEHRHCLGVKFQSLFRPQDFHEFYEDISTDESLVNFEVELIRPMGGTVWINLSARFCEQDDCIEGYATDITSRRKVEKETTNVLKEITTKATERLDTINSQSEFGTI